MFSILNNVILNEQTPSLRTLRSLLSHTNPIKIDKEYRYIQRVRIQPFEKGECIDRCDKVALMYYHEMFWANYSDYDKYNGRNSCNGVSSHV